MITVACGIIMVFLAPGFGTAQCAAELKCEHVIVKDPLGLSECLDGKFDACGGESSATSESPDQKLQECLIKSKAMTKITFILLTAMRETIQLSLELLSPEAGRTLAVLLTSVQKELQGQNIEERSLKQKNGCDSIINVSLPENGSISPCVRMLNASCAPKKPREPGDLRPFLLLSAVVCLLKNIPTISATAMLKGMACIVLKAFIIILKKTRASLLMLPVLEFVQVVLRCEVYKPLTKFAERSLLSE